MFDIYFKYKDKKESAPEQIRRYVDIVEEAIKALSTSSPKAARVFDLKMRGVSSKAISSVLEISVPQVSRYLAEANTFLKNHIHKSAQIPDQNL